LALDAAVARQNMSTRVSRPKSIFMIQLPSLLSATCSGMRSHTGPFTMPSVAYAPPGAEKRSGAASSAAASKLPAGSPSTVTAGQASTCGPASSSASGAAVATGRAARPSEGQQDEQERKQAQEGRCIMGDGSSGAV
jgi:hypothetical protein